MRTAAKLTGALVASLLGIVPVSAQDPPELTGRFVVVTFRAASNVVSTLAVREANWREELIGRSIDFDNPVAWLDDSACLAPWEPRAASERFLWVDDPNLSDLQIAPGADDRRLNQPIIVDCGARPLSSIKLVLVVDDRVLVTTTTGGETYFVLERPLDQPEALALEEGLRDLGVDPGNVDGVVDEATRAAVAALAEAHGAAYRFQSGVITRNLLDFVSPRPQ